MITKLINENRLMDAHIVAKNEYIRNTTSDTAFDNYFGLCLKIAQYPIEIATRKFFVSEADQALSYYSEHVVMNEEILKRILLYKEKLFEITDQIRSLENQQRLDHISQVKQSNNQVLTEIASIKGRLHTAKNQSEFDKLLLELADKERSLLRDFFDEDQQALYDSMTKEFSSLISEKMEQLAYYANIEYNQKAVEDLRKAFTLFKADEAKYINSDTSLFNLVSKRLFAYDSGKLFNEALIYYNHVYSYIFSKLNDDGKYTLTKYSIDADRIIQ